MLPKLCHLEGRKFLIDDNLSSHLSDTIIETCSQNNIDIDIEENDDAEDD